MLLQDPICRSPCTTTWLLGTSICWPSGVCAYWRTVVPCWAPPELAMVTACRPWMPSDPGLASWIVPLAAIATGTNTQMAAEFYEAKGGKKKQHNFSQVKIHDRDCFDAHSKLQWIAYKKFGFWYTTVQLQICVLEIQTLWKQMPDDTTLAPVLYHTSTVEARGSYCTGHCWSGRLGLWGL